MVVRIPISDDIGYGQPKTLIIEPLHRSSIDIASGQQICVRHLHSEQQGLNFVHATGPLALHTLRPVNFNFAEKTVIVLQRLVKAAFHLAAIHNKSSLGKDAIGHTLP